MLGFAARFHSGYPPLTSVSNAVLPEAGYRQKDSILYNELILSIFIV